MKFHAPLVSALTTLTTLTVPGTWVLTLLVAGCATTVEDVNACTSDDECGPGLACNGGGACVAATDDGCETDLECDLGQGESCSNGQCRRPPAAAPAEPPVVDDGCPDNASVVPGLDQCVCDEGYAPTDDATACLPALDPEPDEPEEPAEPEQPAEPAEPAEPGEPDEPDEPAPPPTAPPEDETGDECPPGSSVDPWDPAFCVCDCGLIPDASGTQCVDECAELGYYGDGEYCDWFCLEPDPDCG